MNTGYVIALNVILLYTLLGPLVLLGIYVFFTHLSEPADSTHPTPKNRKKDPALWSPVDTDSFLKIL